MSDDARVVQLRVLLLLAGSNALSIRPEPEWEVWSVNVKGVNVDVGSDFN